MSILNKVVALLLVAFLMGCGSTGDAVHGENASGVDDAAPGASAEDLYFELMRLESAGLLPSGRMDAVQRALDEVSPPGSKDSEDVRERQRAVLASFLNRTRYEARPGEDAAVLAAWEEGRGYARKLNRAGVHEAERYAENTVLIAGMMGVPTSKEDLVLMVAILKENVWNLSGHPDNCTACVATVIRNSLEGYFKHSADDMERLFGYAGRDRQFNIKTSLRYIEDATGLTATTKPVSMIESQSVVGHYAVFTRWSEGQYHHVVYGRVTPTGRAVIFDPQTMEHMNYEQMLKRYGKASPYRLENPE